MIEKEKAQTDPTEKKDERVFVLGIGKGPKMRTLEFVFTPVEKGTETDSAEPAKTEDKKEDKKQNS